MGDHHLRKITNLKINRNWGGGGEDGFHNDLHDAKLQYLHVTRLLMLFAVCAIKLRWCTCEEPWQFSREDDVLTDSTRGEVS